VPAEVRPREVRGALPPTLHPVWERATDPDGTVRGWWGQLSEVYRDGYGAVVRLIAHRMPDPEARPDAWCAAPRRGVLQAADFDNGVILRVRRERSGWSMYSAFRDGIPAYVKIPCPPNDPASVSRRGRLYGQRARRLLARHADAEESS